MSPVTVAVRVIAAVAFVCGFHSLAAHHGSQFRCPFGIWMGVAFWVAGALLTAPTSAWLWLIGLGVSLVAVSIWTVWQLADRRGGGT